MNSKVLVHPLRDLEERLCVERDRNSTSDNSDHSVEETLAVTSPSGFMVTSPSGFMVTSPSGFMVT